MARMKISVQWRTFLLKSEKFVAEEKGRLVLKVPQRRRVQTREFSSVSTFLRKPKERRKKNKAVTFSFTSASGEESMRRSKAW